MFDRLIDLLVQFIDLFRFWTVIKEFERGVGLRLGRFWKVMEPGLHWIIPFGIDEVLVDNVVTRTCGLNGITMTLRDGITVNVSAIVRFNIRDIKKALLEVEGIDDVIRDCTYGFISDVVRHSTWDELIRPETLDVVTTAARRRAWKYGIEIENVAFTDLTKAKALALIQS